MAYSGNDIYDNDEFFSRYIAKRRSENSPNALLEEPIIDELIDPVRGKKLLDLGCGDGLYGKKLLERGLQEYYGLDAS